jgi:hypothetical protein
MSSEVVGQDLNQVIASAVQARIETEVIAALTGSEVMAEYVRAALHEPIAVRDSSSYRDRQTTFLAETLRKAYQEAAKAAVAKVLQDEAPAIEAEVAKELRRNVKAIASTLVGGVSEQAKSSYGITLKITYGREP